MIATLDTVSIAFEPFTSAHLDAAALLSHAEGWPHRREDVALIAELSQGVVATVGGRMVGTALATRFGDVAMLNMIIVAPQMRGRGLGRSLVTRAMATLSPHQWRLTATADGLPLYRKLGFVEAGEIIQHQGLLGDVLAPLGVAWATPADTRAMIALDRDATGMDRAALITALAASGRLAVLRDGGTVTGYATIRAFGRGEVAGPVVATTASDAKRLMSFLFAGRAGAFLRVDTQADSGLSPWLEEIGLAPVGGGIPMTLGDAPCAPTPARSFALAAQALG